MKRIVTENMDFQKFFFFLWGGGSFDHPDPLSVQACGLFISISHCAFYFYLRINFLYLPRVSNSVVCLFVLLQGKILSLLYFINGIIKLTDRGSFYILL